MRAAFSLEAPSSRSSSYMSGFLRLRFFSPGIVRSLLSEHRLAAGDAQHGAGHVARIALGREEDERRGDLGRLAGASERGVHAELLDLLDRLGGRLQRRPDRPGCHGVDPDAVWAELG